MRILNTLIALAVVGFTYLPAQPPTLAWSKHLGGTRLDQGRAIAVDPAGNVYTAGMFGIRGDFDPGPGTFNLIANGISYDMFVCKLDPNGDLIWAKGFGGSGGDEIFGMTVDSLGNVYATGFFTYTADFDPGPATANLTSTGSSRDIFILKLDADGDFVWVRQFSGNGEDLATAIAVDGAGNVYTTGFFQYSVDFDPGPAILSFDAGPGPDEDIFVAKLDSAGSLVWARHFASPSLTAWGMGIAVDPSGNVFTTGFFEDTTDFDPGPGTLTLASQGSSDVFLSKLDPAGNCIWVKQMGGIEPDMGNALAIDAAGNVYLTGAFGGTADFDPGPGTLSLSAVGYYDAFLAKFDPNGNLLWGRDWGSFLLDQGFGIAWDGGSHIYTTGRFEGSMDANPGPGTFQLNGLGNEEMYISQFDTAGNFQWAGAITGSLHEEGFAIAADVAGNFYTTGLIDTLADVDPGPAYVMQPTHGRQDILVHKMRRVPPLGIPYAGGHGVAVYPNPTHGAFTVTWEEALAGKDEPVSIVLTDALGKVLFFRNCWGMDRMTFDLDLPGGVYFVSVRSAGGHFTRRIVKE